MTIRIMSAINESIVEDAAMTLFGGLGYAIAHGPHKALGELCLMSRDILSPHFERKK